MPNHPEVTGVFLQALIFNITSAEDGRFVGAGLVCMDARYASVRWAEADDLDRLHVTPADWVAIGEELGAGVNPGPVTTDGRLYMLVAGEFAGYAIVQSVSDRPVAVDRPEEATPALDALLREVSRPQA
jgi:hypothetical protein